MINRSLKYGNFINQVELNRTIITLCIVLLMFFTTQLVCATRWVQWTRAVKTWPASVTAAPMSSDASATSVPKTRTISTVVKGASCVSVTPKAPKRNSVIRWVWKCGVVRYYTPPTFLRSIVIPLSFSQCLFVIIWYYVSGLTQN